jgi:hypothetical protein
MSRSKKIFFLVAIAFFLLLLCVTYDLSRRTTFPGSPKKSLSTGADTLQGDSLASDTL